MLLDSSQDQNLTSDNTIKIKYGCAAFWFNIHQKINFASESWIAFYGKVVCVRYINNHIHFQCQPSRACLLTIKIHNYKGNV